jgi:hypothetical protein
MTDAELNEAAVALATAGAPKVTLDHIHGLIANVAYHTHDHLTICILTLKNGFFVVGKAAPVYPANYVREIGEKNAHEDAIKQIWQLEGYLLCQRKHEEAEWDEELAKMRQPV